MKNFLAIAVITFIVAFFLIIPLFSPLFAQSVEPVAKLVWCTLVVSAFCVVNHLSYVENLKENV